MGLLKDIGGFVGDLAGVALAPVTGGASLALAKSFGKDAPKIPSRGRIKKNNEEELEIARRARLGLLASFQQSQSFGRPQNLGRSQILPV